MIWGVTVINAIIGFVQESKAESAIAALAAAVETEALVRREGQPKQVSSRELVPGDMVLLNSGDKVPADLRLLRGRTLQINESALTGESVAVEKQPDLDSLPRIPPSPIATTWPTRGALSPLARGKGWSWPPGWAPKPGAFLN